MEPNESGGLGSYFHPQQPPQPPSPLNHAPPTSSVNASPNNGILSNASNPASSATAPTSSPMVYSSHSVPAAVSSGGLVEVKRKRGRPRKYNTPGEAAAAKRQSSAAAISSPKKKDLAFSGGTGGVAPSSSKKFHPSALGDSGQSFTPHIINVVAGEDVRQKIRMFMQQSKREICIISASGYVSNVTLRQPSASGGNVSYEGQFHINTLSGSYVRTEHGERTGGLSICVSTSDGQILGGGVDGPLMAAGPIQVVVATFVMEVKKEVVSGARGGEASGGKSPSPIGGASNSGVSMWHIDSSYPSIGGSQFMIQSQPQSQSELASTFTVDGLEGASQSDFAAIFPKWQHPRSQSKLDNDT
ncbi:OLC1v1026484C1 [Oldenlandia corymbosa var. corymbosa]|uniref:AT-hook motif nuclear-localized protein n=1 Tax=Oldenlandia corymbosa var. corymbosa TaxID=529605 RepID=A0AAV1C7S1_OLDCO|nr:OLC1v1026484C1 [Oldenlandia corymbosa var. corymbosa]